MTLRPLLSALAALGVLVAAGGAGAAEIYVSPSGNGNGNSPSTPTSLSQANSRVRAGDVVILAGGTYSTSINPSSAGNASNWVTYRAADGELPIIDNAPGSGVALNVEYVRIDGIVSRNNSSIGFTNQYSDMCAGGTAVSSGHLEFRNVIADANGISGIAFFCATGVRIENAIVAHNGLGSSWSSGVNLYGARGGPSQSIVRRVVAFENVDISSARSDGSGFILDIGSEGALFENNLGFRNGGSCFRITRSNNGVFINNSCFDNSKYDQYGDEIFFSNSGDNAGALIRNNILVPASGKVAVGGVGASSVPKENNILLSGGAAAPFWRSTTGELDFRLVAGATDAIDKGSSSSAPVDDLGFDPRCVRRQTGQSHPRCNSDCASKTTWFSYAVDYAYIASIGGVKACFAPATRSGAPDIGAYEASAAGSGGAGGGAGMGGAGAGGAGAGGAGGAMGGAGGAGGATGGVAGTASGGAGGVPGGAAGSGGAGGAGGLGAGGSPAGGFAGFGGSNGGAGAGGVTNSGGSAGSGAGVGGFGAEAGFGGFDAGGTLGGGGVAGQAGTDAAGGAVSAGTSFGGAGSGAGGALGGAGAFGAAGAAGGGSAGAPSGAAGSVATGGLAGATALPGSGGAQATGGAGVLGGASAGVAPGGSGGDDFVPNDKLAPMEGACSCRVAGGADGSGLLRGLALLGFAAGAVARRRRRGAARG